MSSPMVYWSIVPPAPRCESCGAIPEAAYGPVIPMTSRDRSRDVDWAKVIEDLMKRRESVEF